jgi:hypothetical protein
VSTFARIGSDIAIPLVLETDPQTCAEIRINDSLNLNLGEYQFDLQQGFPWIVKQAGGQQPTGILGRKNPSISGVKSLIRAAILQVPGITSVLDVSASFNAQTRQLAYAWQAVDNTGALISGGSAAFIVPGGAGQ